MCSRAVGVADMMGSELQFGKACTGSMSRRQVDEVCAVARWRWRLRVHAPTQRSRTTSGATDTTHQESCRCVASSRDGAVSLQHSGVVAVEQGTLPERDVVTSGSARGQRSRSGTPHRWPTSPTKRPPRHRLLWFHRQAFLLKPIPW